MPADALVSVIIPTHGRNEFLTEALQSVSSQGYRPVEIVIVDDCSPERVEPPNIGDTDVRLVRHLRNLGPGAARNTGLAHARGEFVIFLDDDDRLSPDRVETGLNAIGNARMHACRGTFPTPRYDGDMRATILHGYPPFLGQVLLRREDLVQFDPTLRVGEDVEWWIRMRDRAVFTWSDDLGWFYGSHDTPRPGVSAEVRARCRATVLERHWADLDADARAFHANRAGGAELVARHFGRASRFAVRSFIAKPNRTALKIAYRSILRIDRSS